jgi:hypothetical protein
VPKLKVSVPTKWQGLVANPSKFFGFIYKVTNLLDNTMYLGKKQYWKLNPKRTRKKPTCDTSGAWQPAHWKDSDWRSYTGSCTTLNEDIGRLGIENFKFEIIGQYSTKGDLSYAEVEAIIKQDALTMRDDEGQRVYYNGNVGAIRFIPPNKEQETL